MYKSKFRTNNDLHACDLEHLTYEEALMWSGQKNGLQALIIPNMFPCIRGGLMVPETLCTAVFE